MNDQIGGDFDINPGSQPEGATTDDSLNGDDSLASDGSLSADEIAQGVFGDSDPGALSSDEIAQGIFEDDATSGGFPGDDDAGSATATSGELDDPGASPTGDIEVSDEWDDPTVESAPAEPSAVPDAEATSAPAPVQSPTGVDASALGAHTDPPVGSIDNPVAGGVPAEASPAPDAPAPDAPAPEAPAPEAGAAGSTFPEGPAGDAEPAGTGDSGADDVPPQFPAPAGDDGEADSTTGGSAFPEGEAASADGDLSAPEGASGDVTVTIDGQAYAVGEPSLDITGDGVADTVVVENDGNVEYYVDTDQDGVADQIIVLSEEDGTLISHEVYDPAAGTWTNVTEESASAG